MRYLSYGDIVIDKMSGTEFEHLILQLVRKMGFDAHSTKSSGDGGVDIVAFNEKPFLEGLYIIQCKRWNSSIGEPILRDLYGVVMSERANKGILVTTSYFTQSAISFADGKPIELIDGRKLDDLLKTYNLLSDSLLDKSDFEIPMPLSLDSYFAEYENYMLLCDELENNPDNILTRCKAIDYFVQRIFHFTKYSIGKAISYTEMSFLISECRKHFKFFENYETDDKRILGIKFFTVLCDAQMYIIQGDFLGAVKSYNRCLEWNAIIDNANHDSDYLCIIANLMQAYNVLGLTSKTEKIYAKYEDFIEAKIKSMKSVLKQSENIDGLFFDLLYVLDNYRKVTAFFFGEFHDNENVDLLDDSDVKIIDATERKNSNVFYDERSKWYHIITVSEESCFYNFYDNDKRNYDYNIGSYGNTNTHTVLYNERGNIIGIEDFPLWDKAVLASIVDAIKKVDLLY